MGMGLAMRQGARWPAEDADATTVMAAFTTPPSDLRRHEINRFVLALKAGGVWSKLDALWVLAAHDAQAARVNWKNTAQVATETASPTFTADEGYTFNGTSNYLATGFVPSTDCTQATGTVGSHGVYERTNLASSTQSYGATTPTANLTIIPRNAIDLCAGQYNHAASGAQVASTDSRGLWVYQRDGTGGEYFYRGASQGTVTPTTPTSSLVAVQLYIGCRNNNGTAATFRASHASLVFMAGLMTAGEHAAFYAAVQTYMTSLGAAV